MTHTTVNQSQHSISILRKETDYKNQNVNNKYFLPALPLTYFQIKQDIQQEWMWAELNLTFKTEVSDR